MSIIRIIPRLDIKGPNLVKGIHLEGLRVLGRPEIFAKYYYENGADELFYQDVVASLYERNSLKEMITRTAQEIFIPLTIGGGLRSVEDIRDVLNAGADKVSLNTAVIKDPSLISKAADKFGSSTIVIAIEAIKSGDGRHFAFVDNGREPTGLEVCDWAQKAEKLGAGELFVTSVDQEGTGLGFDEDLIHKVSSVVNIPVIAHGGCGDPGHIESIVREDKNGCVGADAVAISSILHYAAINELSEKKSNITEGNTSFIEKKTEFKKIKPHSISLVKSTLVDRGVECRV